MSILYSAIRKYGVPEVLVSDSVGVFLSHDARRIYNALGIEKQEIKKGKPYQNYIEAAFGVQRRMADWSFEKAQTWEDLLAAHEKWLRDYNFQKHMAHEEREDGCHSPAAMLNWQRGMQPKPALLYHAFSAIGETRVLNKAGYARFRNFLLYGEQGLAGQETLVNIFQDTLTLEYEEYTLSKYSVEWQPDDKHLLRVGNPRLYAHPYQLPQLPLWKPAHVEWSGMLFFGVNQRHQGVNGWYAPSSSSCPCRLKSGRGEGIRAMLLAFRRHLVSEIGSIMR